MKDNWLDEIRKGLSDFEMDAPEGLWESLGIDKPVSKGVWRRRWIVAAAVISILLIGSGIIMWLAQTKPIEINNIKYAAANGLPSTTLPESISTENQGNTQALNESPHITPSQPQKTSIQNNSEKTKENIDAYMHHEEAFSSLLDTVKAEELSLVDQAIDSDEKTRKEKDLEKECEKNFYANISPKNRKGASDYSGKFAINISAAGIGNTSEGSTFWMPGQSGNDLFWGSTLPTTKIQHHMPFRIGLTVQYNISKKFAIESGLVYSRIGSDISISHDNFLSMATRRMHYVGIPLNVKFSAWSWKLINVYLSAGATGEKCISNRFEVKAISDALPLDDFAKQTEKPFQWSVNAAAGIQLRPTPNIGIFAEPGVSYFFNDGSNISTIYKDHPCNFNLNLGIRFTLNP